jgi:MYXO-CTERM domain-containing protein
VTVLPAVSAVPEPTSALLALSGLAGVAALRRKRRPA